MSRLKLFVWDHILDTERGRVLLQDDSPCDTPAHPVPLAIAALAASEDAAKDVLVARVIHYVNSKPEFHDCEETLKIMEQIGFDTDKLVPNKVPKQFRELLDATAPRIVDVETALVFLADEAQASRMMGFSNVAK